MNVFSKCIYLCNCHCLCICLCHCLFFGQVMSPRYSDKMSQRSQVSGMAFLRCSLNVFVFVIVFFSVFVFVIFLVRSSLLIPLIKCLKGHKSLGSLLNVKNIATGETSPFITSLTIMTFITTSLHHYFHL